MQTWSINHPNLANFWASKLNVFNLLEVPLKGDMEFDAQPLDEPTSLQNGS